MNNITELTEEEILQKEIIKKQEAEEFDSASVLVNNLAEALGGVSPEKVAEIQNELISRGENIQKKTVSLNKSNITENLPKTYSTEKLLLSLYDAHDELISAFEALGTNAITTKQLCSAIAKVEHSIITAGGDVERFIVANHLSGLAKPNFQKNAEKVIETTLQCYNLGKVNSAKLQDNGKSINFVFSGETDSTAYQAEGIITAEEWIGNEAIDYVYTPGEGHMSVKAFENGRWVVKSSDNDSRYKVAWTLKEKQINVEKNTKTEVVQREEQNKDDAEIGEPLN